MNFEKQIGNTKNIFSTLSGKSQIAISTSSNEKEMSLTNLIKV